MKRLAFIGSSRSDLREFPETGWRKAGYQLEQVQFGKDPDDWKPMPTIGSGVREIRVKEPSGAFRVIYIAAFAETVFVLHAFQKKSQRTAMLDLELATTRYKTLARSMTK